MTNTTNGPIIIDTPEGLAFFQLLQLEGRLSIEINTGLKFRGPNTRVFVNDKFGTKFPASAKGKQAALDFVRERILDAKCEKALREMGYDVTKESIDWIRPAVRADENERLGR